MVLMAASTKNPLNHSVSGSEILTADSASTHVDEANSKGRGKIGHVQSILASSIVLSWMSSAKFHLVILGILILAYQLSGNALQEPAENEQISTMGALGDENVVDDLPMFEFGGGASAELEIPAGGGDDVALQISEQLKKISGGMNGSAGKEIWNGLPVSNAAGVGGNGTGILLKVPKSGLAVTKGSFTAFTIPAKPRPRQSYSIVIEIRVANGVKKFRVSDLSGQVRGSDGYVQKLPFDSRSPSASGYPVENDTIKTLDNSTVLDVVNNRVQLVIKVPGAAQLVKDEIRIRSKRLREEQVLTLVFQDSDDER